MTPKQLADCSFRDSRLVTNIRRLVYLGTPEVAVPPLHALVDAGFEVVLVVSNPDKRRGRGKELSPSPVKAAALELGLPVTDDPADVLNVEADLGVVVAYGRIIKTDVLAHLSMVNIHFSLLPRWRGAAPLERALLSGDDVTGVCLMELAEELDSGGVYRRSEVPITDEDSLDSLRTKLVNAGSALLVTALSEGLGEPEPQEGEITWARKVSNEDFVLDWTRSADELGRIIRVGRAHTTFRGKRFRIHESTVVTEFDPHGPGQPSPGVVDTSNGVLVGCGEGALELGMVQPEGKPRLAASDWVNGAQLTNDDRLGS